MSSKSLLDLRKLQKHQFSRVTKEELIDAIMSANEDDVIARPRQEEKLDLIVKDLAELRQMIMASENDSKRRIKELTETIEKQSEILFQHQLFLEQLDRQKRETNLVLFGVPDDQIALEGALTDDAKVQKIMGAIGIDPDIMVRKHRRLGQSEQGSNRPRPLLIGVDSKFIRDEVLEKSVRLKDLQIPYKKIFIKKDSHPGVRKEWKRLKEAEEEEKRKPSNVGCDIRLDYKERVLYKDGLVIDKWRPHPF